VLDKTTPLLPLPIEEIDPQQLKIELSNEFEDRRFESAAITDFDICTK
jgi:hypothetical protein